MLKNLLLTIFICTLSSCGKKDLPIIVDEVEGLPQTSYLSQEEYRGAMKESFLKIQEQISAPYFHHQEAKQLQIETLTFGLSMEARKRFGIWRASGTTVIDFHFEPRGE